MQQQGSGAASSTTTTGGRRRVSVRGAAASAASASVWEARMRMDEVKGGVKVFSGAGAADEPADEEGMRVYRRLRRNQSDGTGGAGGAGTAAAKKRRNWKASEPVTAIGDLRKSRSDAAASAAATAAATTTITTTAVVARRAVARVAAPERKVALAAPGGEVKEVVVVEVHKAQAEEAKRVAEEAKSVAEEPEEELGDDVDELDDEELETEEEEEEKEMLDQDHMVIDNDETALHQVDDDDDLEPLTKGINPTLLVEDERAANPEPVKPAPVACDDGTTASSEAVPPGSVATLPRAVVLTILWFDIPGCNYKPRNHGIW